MLFNEQVNFRKRFIVKVSVITADEVAQVIIDELKPYKIFVHSLTSDNGKKFAFL